MSFVYSIILLSTSSGFMILGNALAWLFFDFYNEKLHPFQQILDTSDGIRMEKLSIWNDFITVKQRYLNVLHGMTRIDEHPRQINLGKHMYQAILRYLKD